MDLLSAFADCCEENHLTYYLAYGSCLGAVRHQGLIPWDDDIDVSMPREDYNKLLQLVRDKKVNLNILSKENTDGYPQFFAKVSDTRTVLTSLYMNDIEGLGAFVDIFPMDSVQLTEKHKQKLKKGLSFFIKMMSLSEMKKFWPSGNKIKSAFKQCAFVYAKRKGHSYWYKKYLAILKKATLVKETDQVSYVMGKCVLDRDLFGAGTKCQFGDRKYICPKNTDEYLTCLYGDYMKLPPEDQRVSVHDFQAWYR